MNPLIPLIVGVTGGTVTGLYRIWVRKRVAWRCGFEYRYLGPDDVFWSHDENGLTFYTFSRYAYHPLRPGVIAVKPGGARAFLGPADLNTMELGLLREQSRTLSTYQMTRDTLASVRRAQRDVRESHPV